MHLSGGQSGPELRRSAADVGHVWQNVAPFGEVWPSVGHTFANFVNRKRQPLCVELGQDLAKFVQTKHKDPNRPRFVVGQLSGKFETTSSERRLHGRKMFAASGTRLAPAPRGLVEWQIGKCRASHR